MRKKNVSKIPMSGVMGGLLIWAVYCTLVTGVSTWMGQSGDAANGIPVRAALRFFCFMVFGVPLWVVIGIPILAIITAFSSASKKNVIIER